MKSLNFSGKLIDAYFDLLKNMSDEAKKRLIERLESSLGRKKDNRNSGQNLFGAWQSKDSADEIINEIYTSRNTGRLIEDL